MHAQNHHIDFEIYKLLQEDVRMLSNLVFIFNHLFTSLHQNADELKTNYWSPSLLGIIQYTVASDIIIRISALSDPAKQGNNKNFSLLQIAKQLERSDALASDLSSRIEERIKKDDIKRLCGNEVYV